MLRRIAARARPAERPSEHRDFLNASQLANVIDDGVDVVPVGAEIGQLSWILRHTRLFDQIRNELLLLIGGQVARIVHFRGPNRSAVAGRVH
jgi:hypothetical protein